jgi:PAS domain S-box-containing protein
MQQPPINFRKKHRRSRRVWLAGALSLHLLLPDYGFALDPAREVLQYNCQTWSRQNGLPATSINTIAQTRDGYLWFGTAAGLLRFDGTEFKLFDLHSVAALRTSYVTSLASARSGGLWVGLAHSAFGFYDGRSFSFRGAKEPGLDVQSILESRNGTLWLAAQQLAGHLNQSGELETNLPSTSFTNANPNVKCVYEDRQGRVWFGTLTQGAFYWQDGKITKLPAPDLEGVPVNCITEDLAGQIWIGSQNGLYCYDASLKRREIPPLPSAVSALLVDRHGVLWIGTSWIGLARYENGRYDFFLKTDGLDNETVQALGEDSEGSLWIGTGGGLDRLSDVKFPIQPATEDPKITDANSVTAARNGGVWIASYGGVRGFDPRTRTYTYGPGLPDIYTKRVFEARNGDLYFIVGMTNLEVASGGNIVARYGAPDLVVGMAEDDQGIVVSVAGELYRAGTNYFRPYTFKGSERPQFNWIANLASGRDGVIWVASGNGIFRVKDGAWQGWSAAEGLADPAVQTICEDQDGVVWAGLLSGIARLKDNQIRLISRKDGLFDDNIYAIVPDDLGNLWVDSGRGISRVVRRDMNAFADDKTNHVACTVFDGIDSVKTTDKTAQERVGCKTADGRIWFPGPRGVVMIDPAHVPANPMAPPVHIERVLADGREVARNANTAVPPGKGELQFRFNALSFSAPSKVQIRYRLEGYDKDWVDAGDRRLAFYTNLKPAPYTFRVIAANADGVWNETGDALNIELRPHYYQTAWFRLLCGGLAFAALIGIYLQRVRHMKLKQQSLQKTRDLLEAEVLNRTGELSYERDLLRSLLDYSPDSIYFKDAQSHFLKTSKAQAKLFGVKSADELVGKTDFDFFTEEHARPAFADEQEIIRTGRPLIGKVEKEVLKGGQETWALTSKMPLRNKDGKIIGTFGISKDITTIKKVEAELAYQRDLLGTLMNHSPDSIFFKDLQSRFVRLSRSEVNNLRRVSLSHRAPHPAGEEDSLPPHLANLEEFEKYVIGKSDADIYGRDRAGAFGHDEEEIMRTGQPMIGKIEQTICPDGSTIWFMTTKVPWRNKDGEIIGTFGTSREISDLKNTEAKLEQVHKQLLETSRRAGMAEIAANVLHNVGNVLNSVNVSASLVADGVKKSKVASLANVVALLREHEHDLGTFITSDSKGKQLPGYLSQLSDHLLADQKKTVKELDSLQGNIEHIKEIVAMQQSYATVAGVKEIINIRELVEDSLRINEGTLNHQHVEVIREFETVPLVNVEKHKILQILVNLIRNAKHACQESERVHRRLTVRVANGAGRVKISVIDNGIGISPENLTRIFNHGFTTRKGGHGFGLHSGALAAKEMDGSLSVTSDGPGQGATFILELPCTTHEDSNE